jgi:hypothetical protein
MMHMLVLFTTKSVLHSTKLDEATQEEMFESFEKPGSDSIPCSLVVFKMQYHRRSKPATYSILMRPNCN